ncbi:MAG: hypothetical protein WKF87_06565 [Chryseolinea sp.]
MSDPIKDTTIDSLLHILERKDALINELQNDLIGTRKVIEGFIKFGRAGRIEEYIAALERHIKMEVPPPQSHSPINKEEEKDNRAT